MVKYWFEVFLHIADENTDLGLRLDYNPFYHLHIVLPPTCSALSRLIPICFSTNQSWAAPCALTNPASTAHRLDGSIHYFPTADDRDDLFDWCFIWSVGISRYGELNEADVIESDAHWSVVEGEFAQALCGIESCLWQRNTSAFPSGDSRLAYQLNAQWHHISSSTQHLSSTIVCPIN